MPSASRARRPRDSRRPAGATLFRLEYRWPLELPARPSLASSLWNNCCCRARVRSRVRTRTESPTRLHRPLDPPHRLRRLVGRAELARVLQHVLHELALADLVHDADLLGLLEGERLAGHDQLDRSHLPTMRDSRCVPPVPGSTPRLTLRQADLAGVLARDAQCRRPSRSRARRPRSAR